MHRKFHEEKQNRLFIHVTGGQVRSVQVNIIMNNLSNLNIIEIINIDHNQNAYGCIFIIHILDDPEVSANIYCKSRNLPNTDTQNCSTDLR